MVQMLLEFDQIQLGDAVLHAVEAGNKNLVIQLLDRMGCVNITTFINLTVTQC